MKKILLATTLDSLRDAIEFALLQKNYQLMLTDNGSDAIKLMDEHQIDLLISCLNLPVIDGLSLSALLREQVNNRFTPVLLLLNSPIPPPQVQLLACNSHNTLNIPFDMQELLFKIEKLLPC